IEPELLSAKRGERALDHAGDRAARGDIDRQRQGLAALAVDQFCRRASARFVDVGTHDVGALAGEDQRGGAADAAPRAGDDDGLTGEIVRRLRHGSLVPMVCGRLCLLGRLATIAALQVPPSRAKWGEARVSRGAAGPCGTTPHSSRSWRYCSTFTPACAYRGRGASSA